MPSASTRQTLARQWELLKRLPGRGQGRTAKELTEILHDAGFAVSKRQVERDLGDLLESFPLECSDDQLPYRWRWAPGASTHIPGLSLADALSLHLIEETLRPLLPASVLQAIEPRLRQAEAKLSEHHQAPLSRWAEKVRCIPPAMPLLAPKVDPDVLATVQAALLQERQLEALYRGMEAAEPRTLTLHPLGLVQRGPVTYLIATAFDYPDRRLYALQRFTEALMTERRIVAHSPFDLDRFIARGGLQFVSVSKRIRLQLRVSEALARILEETPLGEDQECTIRGEEHRVQVSVPDSWQLRWWILSQGEGVEVQRPAALRREIAATLRQALVAYQDPE